MTLSEFSNLISGLSAMYPNAEVNTFYPSMRGRKPINKQSRLFDVAVHGLNGNHIPEFRLTIHPGGYAPPIVETVE